MMIAATSQASTCTHQRLTNGPIFCLLLVNLHQRHHGEGQLQAEDHLAEDQQLVDALRRPTARITTTAGTMASSRVISRRSQGRMRNRRKPSIVICPASVPVIVELCPAQSSARAKAIGASRVPSTSLEQGVGLLDLGHRDAAARRTSPRPRSGSPR